MLLQQSALISPSSFYTLLGASGWLTPATFHFWRGARFPINPGALMADNALHESLPFIYLFIFLRPASFDCKWQGRVFRLWGLKRDDCTARVSQRAPQADIHQWLLAWNHTQSHQLIKRTSRPPVTPQEQELVFFLWNYGHNFLCNNNSRDKLYIHNIGFSVIFRTHLPRYISSYFNICDQKKND